MRTLDELLDTSRPAIDKIRSWIERSTRPCTVLPPAPDRGDRLVQAQVSTRAPLGAVIHETGGILIDHGWIRLLGSGHERLGRSLPAWNEGRGLGFLLVADDAVSGFFAINGGGLGEDPGKIHYLAADRLQWEPLGIGYPDFVRWCLGQGPDEFYAELRWEGWEDDMRALHGDRTFGFYPPLWAADGGLGRSERRSVRTWDAYRMKLEAISQLA